MKKIVLKEIFKAFMSALAVGFVLFACLAQAIPLKNEPVVDIGDSVIRLRVVANSSKERDCEIKLAVRDALLKNAPELFGSCESPESARLAVRTNLFLVKRIAAEAVRKCGSQDDVRVHFGYESAPVRRYGAYTVPADDYLTLRVDIGKADGRNWWCVLYPPLCLAGATAENAKKSGKNSDVTLERDVFLSYGFSEKQLDALKNASEESDKSGGKPVVRSALFDLFCKLIG